MSDEKGTDRQFMGVRCRVRDRSRDFFRETENAGDAIRNPVRFPRVAKRRRVAIGGCRRRAVRAPATVRSRGRRREFGANLTFASMGVAKTCGDGGTGGGREGTVGVSPRGSISSRAHFEACYLPRANYMGRHRAVARVRDRRGDASARRSMTKRNNPIDSLT